MPPKKESNNNNTITAASTTIGASSSSAASSATQNAAASAEIAAAEQKQALYQANTKLCRLVKRCPWMYDRQHPNYAKKTIMDKSWAKIAKDCDDSVASCKERWRNMRAAFARSINIYKTNSGPNRVKPYYLHNELRFLITPMMEGRESINKDVDIKTDFDDSNMAQSETTDNTTTTAQQLETIGAKSADTPTPIAQQQQQHQQQSDNISEVGTDFDFPEIEQLQSPLPTEEIINGDIGGNSVNTTAESVEPIKPNHTIIDTTTNYAAATAFNCKRQKLTNEFSQQHYQQHNSIYASNNNNNSNSSRSNNIFTTTDADADAKFLEALLPDMRAMNARQKIVFKRKIYQSLEEVFETNNDFPISHNNSNNNNHTISNNNHNNINNTTTAGVVTVTANSSAAQNVLRSIASLKENEMHKLQDFLHTIYRQRDGQTVTVIPRGQQQQQQQRSSVPPQANAINACNGRAPQLQPISIKYELLDDVEDVDDFE